MDYEANVQTVSNDENDKESEVQAPPTDFKPVPEITTISPT